jgi:hypothetical protein
VEKTPQGKKMKQIVTVTEVEGEGLEALGGKKVLLMCMNYFYTGTLVGVNTTFVKLDNCSIVYETGPWNEKGFKDAQLVGDNHYVTTQSIESFRQVN